MKKVLKFLMITLLSLVILIVAAAIIIPTFFKDDIKAAIDAELAKSVNADVVYDADNFGLSLFSNFPNITATMEYFGVINRAPFEDEILFRVEKLEVEVNLSSVLFSDKPSLKGITLVHPEVNVKVLADGSANYDIAVPSDAPVEETTTTEEAPADFSFGIDHWQIIDGHIVYDDKSIPYFMELKGVQLTGSGDLTQDVFDLATKATIDSINISFDGTEYLSNKRADIDMILSISDEYGKYTFKENTVKVNDFAFGFDGFLALEDDGFPMDITFKTKENSFKSLLSLVPGVFTEGFEDIKSEGSLSFNGAVKGKYTDATMPAFNINLKVNDAMFQYPDLPTAVENISLDMLVDNKDGNIDNTLVNVKQFHMDFGSNPIDARILIENLVDYKMDANIKANLNLGELTSMFPMDGMTLKGIYSLDASATGLYDSINNIIPKIDVAMALKNGYVKTSDFPIPLEDLHFSSTVKNTSGRMAETKIAVDDFTMIMDNEEFRADMIFENLDDYTWDLRAKGGIDLEKITSLFPLEGMALTGKIKADIETKGKMSDLEAERYANLPTSGSFEMANFTYKDVTLPYDVTISEAKASFDPKRILLESYKGTVGRSDMQASGSISNYIGFLFGENELLKGSMDFSSNLLDLNEFMVEEEGSTDETETTPTEETDTTASGVIPIPKNIDFILKSNVKTAKAMNLVISNATGDIIVRDGVANLSGLKFGMLGGQFVTNGSYDTRDLEHPKYDFDLNVQDLSIKQSYQAFNTVQTLMPIAQLVNGNVNTDFKISGELDDNMLPDYATINGGGLLKIAQAALQDSENNKIISGITNLTNLKDASVVNIKDLVMSAKIEDGKFSVKPFNIKLGNYETTVSGSTGFDQSVSYNMSMKVPAGKLGTKFNSFVNNSDGGDGASSYVDLPIVIGGSFTDPQIKVGDAPKDQIKQAAKSKLKDEGSKLADKVIKDDKAKELVGNLLGGKNKKDSTKSDSTKTDPSKTKLDDVKKDVDRIKNLFKKKKKN
ncbi:MAG: AsmA-like C-terminal region-containing protein [Bacteroidota bacterium]